MDPFWERTDRFFLDLRNCFGACLETVCQFADLRLDLVKRKSGERRRQDWACLRLTESVVAGARNSLCSHWPRIEFRVSA